MNPTFLLLCFILIAGLMMMSGSPTNGASPDVFSPMTTITPTAIAPGVGITPGMFLPV